MEKRLYKSSTDKVLAGVCGGIGEYFDVDPVLIRVLWVVSAFFGGVGVLAYIIAAIIMPEKEMLDKSRTYESTNKTSGTTEQRGSGYTTGDKAGSAERTGTHTVRDSSVMAGVVLVALGGFFLLREFMPWISGGILAAVLFIALGLFLIVTRSGGKK